jgi:hypothetical protein
MKPEHPGISPLQAAMLRDTLACAGRNIEQVEIVFSADVITRVPSAWSETVAATAALRTRFLFQDGEPVGMSESSAEPRILLPELAPSSFEEWLARDREQALDLEGGLPWRVTFWPSARRFVWTFHHALLDGRSITKILRSFLARLTGNEVPAVLEFAVSQVPSSDEIEAADDRSGRIVFRTRRAFARGAEVIRADRQGVECQDPDGRVDPSPDAEDVGRGD